MSKPKIRKDTITIDVTTLGGKPEYVVNECWIVERGAHPWTVHPTWTDAVRSISQRQPVLDRRIFEAHEVPVHFAVSPDELSSIEHYPCQS